MEDNKYRLNKKDGMMAALFIMAVLLFPVHHGIVFWMSVAFTVVSCGIYVFGMHRVSKLQGEKMSKFYERPMEDIVKKFIVAELIACVVFIITGKWVPIWLPMLTYLFMICSVVVGFESDDVVKKAKIEE